MSTLSKPEDGRWQQCSRQRRRLAATRTCDGAFSRYLQQSEWDERLETIRTSISGGLDALGPLLDDVVSPNDAAGLRGAAARMLSSYADVPGLLAVRGFAEALADDCSLDVVIANVQAAIQFALGSYTIPAPEVGAAIGILATSALGRDREDAAKAIVDAAIGSSAATRELVRGIIGAVPSRLADNPAAWLLAALVHDVSRIIPSKGNHYAQ